MNEHAEHSDRRMPFSCLEEGINQCIGTDSEVLNNWWDIFARLPNMCYLFEKWQGMNLPSFIIFNNNNNKKNTPSTNISARRNHKDKELKEGRKEFTTVIKEWQTRNKTQNTPAETDGGSPRKEKRGQRSAARSAGRQK